MDEEYDEEYNEEYDEEYDEEDGEENDKIIKKRKIKKNNLDKYKQTYSYDETKYLDSLSMEERNKLKKLNIEVLDYFKSGDIPLKIKILNSTMSVSAKSSILDKINMFNRMSSRESEYGKMRKYMNLLEKIPFNSFINMPIKKNDDETQINNFINQSYKYLKDSIYGQE